MKKNINLIIDGIAPEKVMYDTDNHSLIVLYPAQEEFKKGDILASDNKALLIFDGYANKEKDMLHSLWNNVGPYGRTYNNNWTTKYFKHATDEQKAQVHELLKKDGKRWNRDTLEVEDIKPEFKRGDIVIYDNTSRVAIFDEYVNSTNKKDFKDITSMMNISNGKYVDVTFNRQWNTDTLRMATGNEARLLFDLLKKIGKRWNRDTLEIEELDISEIVVDLNSACDYLKIKRPSNFILDEACERSDKFEAQMELQLIREAWNKFDGFEVDFEDSGQSKYYPIINLFTGNIEVGVGCVSVTVHSACYSFKSKERAIQFGTQFKDLLETAMGL